MKGSRLKTGFLALLASSLLLPSCSSSPPLTPATNPQHSVRQVPDRTNIQWDLEVGKEVYNQQLATLRKKKIAIDNDPVMVDRLNRILTKLKSQTLMPEPPYEVHYVDHKTVNAVCYPAGHILFSRGVLAAKEGLIDPNNEGEIAAVMGHEMAHATLRHSYKTYRKAQTAGVLGAIASVFIGSAAGQTAADLFATVFDLGTGLYFPSHSRKQESYADLEGLYTILEADFDPENAIRLWERAAQKKSSDKTSFFSTHPSSSNRAQMLRDHLKNIHNQKKP